MATGIDPGGHHFVVLYVSINKKSVFFSEVVTNKKRPLEPIPRGRISRACHEITGYLSLTALGEFFKS